MGGFFSRLGKFFKKVLKFEANNLKYMVDLVKEDPERILIGAIDPFSSKMWGTILGKDYDPIINQWGGAADGSYVDAASKGIDIGPGAAMHAVAKMIAAFYAGQWAMGQMGAAGGAGGGGPNGTIAELDPSLWAPQTPGGVANVAGAAPGAVPAPALPQGVGGLPAEVANTGSGVFGTPPSNAPIAELDPALWAPQAPGGAGAVVPASSGGASSGAWRPTLEQTGIGQSTLPPINSAPPPTNPGGVRGLLSKVGTFAKDNPLITGSVLEFAGGAMQNRGGDSATDVIKARGKNYAGTDPGQNYRGIKQNQPGDRVQRMYGGYEYQYNPETRRIEKVATG